MVARMFFCGCEGIASIFLGSSGLLGWMDVD